MTTLGKTLLVFQVFFSVSFMMFAVAVYHAETNWKTEAQGLEASLQTEQRERATVEKDLANFKLEADAKFKEAQNRGDKFEAKADSLSREKQQIDEELVNTRQERDVAVRQASIANEEAEDRLQETQRHRNVIAKLQNDLKGLSEKNRRLADEKYNQQREIEEIVEKHDRLIARFTTLQEVLAHNNIDPDPTAHKGLTTPPPVVIGLVVDTKTITRNNTKLVELSIGSDDGLAVGHKLFAYRPRQEDGHQAKFLGKLEIIKVTPDRAVARLVSGMKNGIIQRGDNVTTKL